MIVDLYVLHEGLVFAPVAEFCFKLAQATFGHDVRPHFWQNRPIDHSRNKAVKHFLHGNGDVLLFLDWDNPPTRNPLLLLSLERDVLVLPTPIWAGGYTDAMKGKAVINWNCMDFIPERDGWAEHQPAEGLQEIDAGGTGCMLIQRRVLEHPELRFPFCRRYSDDGLATHGSDFEFCRRAKKAGFRIWAHYDFWCSHLKNQDLSIIWHVMRARDISAANRSNRNTPEYWDAEWAKRPERLLPVYEPIVEKIRALNAKTVLDYGCGRGDLLSMIAPHVDQAVGVDLSQKAVEICKERGLEAYRVEDPNRYNNPVPGTRWDVIVATEVLEHLDDDRGMLGAMTASADTVLYSVPHNCLPPGIEPEHRRVYTVKYVREITPGLQEITQIDDFLLVTASSRDVSTGEFDDGFRKRILRHHRSEDPQPVARHHGGNDSSDSHEKPHAQLRC